MSYNAKLFQLHLNAPRITFVRGSQTRSFSIQQEQFVNHGLLWPNSALFKNTEVHSATFVMYH